MIDQALVKRFRAAYKHQKEMIRECKKIHGLIHPAVSDAESVANKLSALSDNYVIQTNMAETNPYAKPYADKALEKLVEFLDTRFPNIKE